MNARPPISVDIHRGDLVECRHRVHAVVADWRGRVTEAWGEAELAFYPRSAIKPLQALPLIETGAAAANGVSDEELALACASHSGALAHTMAVAAWLNRVGIAPERLKCGSHRPYDEAAADGLVRRGEPWTVLNSNCSGKHTGMLTTAKYLDEWLDGYLAEDHPVQQRCRRVLEDMGGTDLTRAARGIDGCGIPIYGMPLAAAARAAARLARPDGLPTARAEACRRIVHAMVKHPYMVAGRARFDTIAMQALKGRAAVKTGAEGVHLAFLPGLGLGVALKTEDGAKRAGDSAMAALLDRLGVVDGDARGPLAEFLTPIVRNVAGREVGSIRVALG